MKDEKRFSAVQFTSDERARKMKKVKSVEEVERDEKQSPRLFDVKHEKGFKKPEDVDNEKRVKNLLSEIREKKQELQEVKSDLEEELHEAEKEIRSKPRYAAISVREQTIEEKVETLHEICEKHRSEILPDRKKSRKWKNLGKVGWRAKGGNVKLAGGNRTKDVCEKLKEGGYDGSDEEKPNLIRYKPSLNKSALNSALKDGEVTEEQLKEWGLVRSEERDEWYYKID